MAERVDLLVTGIGELATPVDAGGPLRGEALGRLRVVPAAALAVRDGRILAAGPESEVRARFEGRETIDARGRLVTPGLVDPHTHALFVGTREEEFEWRLGGTAYAEIARRGGGIHSTVRRVREAGKEALSKALEANLDSMLAHGTTTAEVKTGYGLSREAELRSLEVIHEVRQRHAVEVVPTFLGAHEVPLEHRENRRVWIDALVKDLIPEVSRRKLAEYCDVFSEAGVYTVDEAREVLSAGKAHGLVPRIHAEEFTPLGGARMAAGLGAASADHLMALPAEDVPVLAASGTVAVLLPATTLFLGQRPAPARDLIRAGGAVALGTDFNPGSSMTESMQMVMTLACVLYRMTPAEALSAATLNAAHALGRRERLGSLDPGKDADFVVWECEHYRQLPYHFGINQAHVVMKRGAVVWNSQFSTRISQQKPNPGSDKAGRAGG